MADHSISRTKKVKTNEDTGSYETTTTWSLAGSEGVTEASGWSITETAKDGSTSTTSSTQYHDENGKPTGSTIVHTQETDADGEVTKESIIEFAEDGSKTETVVNPDGTKTVTTYDKDGNKVSSETTTHANDEESETTSQPGNGEFWDPDIIYGGLDGEIGTDDDMFLFNMNQEQFAEAGVEILANSMGHEAAEAFVDSFEFIM